MAPGNQQVAEHHEVEDTFDKINPFTIAESLDVPYVNEFAVNFEDEDSSDASEVSEPSEVEFRYYQEDTQIDIRDTSELAANTQEDHIEDHFEIASLFEFDTNSKSEDKTDYVVEFMEFIHNGYEDSSYTPEFFKMPNLNEFLYNWRNISNSNDEIQKVLAFCTMILHHILIGGVYNDSNIYDFFEKMVKSCMQTVKLLDCEKNVNFPEAHARIVEFVKSYYFLTVIHLRFVCEKKCYIIEENISRCIELVCKLDLSHETFMMTIRIYELAVWIYLNRAKYKEALKHVYGAIRLYTLYTSKNDVHTIPNDPLHVFNSSYNDYCAYFVNGANDDIPRRLKKIYLTFLYYLIAIYKAIPYRESSKNNCVIYQHIYLKERLPLLQDEMWRLYGADYFCLEVSLHTAECLLTLNRLEEARDHIALASYILATMPDDTDSYVHIRVTSKAKINLFWVRYGFFLLRLSHKKSDVDRVKNCYNLKHTPIMSKTSKLKKTQSSALLFSEIEDDLKRYKLFPTKCLYNLCDVIKVLENIVICLEKTGAAWYEMADTIGHYDTVKRYKVELYWLILYYYVNNTYGSVPYWKCGAFLENIMRKVNSDNTHNNNCNENNMNSKENYLLLLLRRVASTICMSFGFHHQRINGLVTDEYIKISLEALNRYCHECCYTTELSDNILRYREIPFYFMAESFTSPYICYLSNSTFHLRN